MGDSNPQPQDNCHPWGLEVLRAIQLRQPGFVTVFGRHRQTVFAPGGADTR